ncbi:MAG: adenylate/guanylate cyclase domain-containing response regulator [Cyanothece sp. SIO1E1]|nr:adenylate/guanylate cyclase domain-containing response regulator [Cyanothece sp. SIO1E1]
MQKPIAASAPNCSFTSPHPNHQLKGIILVVDDSETNRLFLSRRLQRQGHTIIEADSGQQALDLLKTQACDLILLDIMMPGISGYQVLEQVKTDPNLRHIPVVMVSALDDVESVAHCIELGAEDYLFKPFNQALLQARIGACLDKKQLRDQEQAYLKQLEAEQKKSEQLLLNVLPKAIADRLKQDASIIADNFAAVTVLFADIVDFTQMAANLPPRTLVEWLNEIFSTFDQLAATHGLEKIKTIGDAYLVVGGLPTPRPDHAEAIAEMALSMQQAAARFHRLDGGHPLSLRIGINTGPVGAGVIGTQKFTYDLWGDTVNTASRMESYGLPGQIQVAPATYACLKNKYAFNERGLVEIKGKGAINTYLLTERRLE